MEKLKKINFDFTVIGGGIIGCAVLHELSKRYPNKSICLIEKESELCYHQTGRNSGVIHSGIYYKPNSTKALNCLKGYKLLLEYLNENNIDFKITGKLIVANNEKEISQLLKLKENADNLGLKGVEILNTEQVKKIEINAVAKLALHVKQTGIVNFKDVADSLVSNALKTNNLNQIFLNNNVKSIIKGKSENKIITSSHEINTDVLICCAGLQSDRFSKLLGFTNQISIVPFKGNYLVIKPKKILLKFQYIQFLTQNYLSLESCYPYTWSKSGIWTQCFFQFCKRKNSRFGFSFVDSFHSLSKMRTWILFFSFFKYGIIEWLKSTFKFFFVREINKIFKFNLDNYELKWRSGIRAQAIDVSGKLVDDFIILKNQNIINIVNAPSPAATAALSIAIDICDKLKSDD